MKKILSIIDCYIHNEDTVDKLELFLDSLLSTDRDILLISNTPIPERIQRKVKFSFYDSNNKLFDENFDYVNDCWSNHWLNDFTIHEHFFSKQYHGLSVLNNLTNSLSLVKSLGYTHFEKFEWDFKLGDNTIKNIESLKRICFLNQKKSIFIVNYNTDKPEFRFDYFMSEINFFEEHFNKINNQEDYKNFIFNHYGNNNFINVEQFLYKCFDGLSNDILLIDNDEIFTLFGDSDINTKISLNYIPKYFNYCTTRLYKINDEKSYVVLTYNYGSEPHNRTIEIVYSDGSTELLHHTVSSPHSFTYNNINENVIKIIVHDNNIPIFEDTVENIKNKITFY
jgi:hypothetical protein